MEIQKKPAPNDLTDVPLLCKSVNTKNLASKPVSFDPLPRKSGAWGYKKAAAVLILGLPHSRAQYIPHPIDPRLPIQCPWPMCFRSEARDALMVKTVAYAAYTACLLTVSGVGGVTGIIGGEGCDEVYHQAENLERLAIEHDKQECGAMNCGPLCDP